MFEKRARKRIVAMFSEFDKFTINWITYNRILNLRNKFTVKLQ